MSGVSVVTSLEWLREYRARCVEAGRDEHLPKIDELLAEFEREAARLDALAVTNPGTARLIARRRGLRGLR